MGGVIKLDRQNMMKELLTVSRCISTENPNVSEVSKSSKNMIDTSKTYGISNYNS
jgi:hypothetical protein